MTTTNIPLDGPINLHARAGHGSLTVTAEDGVSEAMVTLEPNLEDSDVAQRTSVELRGHTLFVTAPRRGGIFDTGLFGGPSRDRDDMDITITVPSGTAMKLSSFTADIRVLGRSGSADIASGASDVELAEIDGDLRLRLASGTAHVVQVTGSVEARSGSGVATFGEIGGSLSSGCGSGRLEVGIVRGDVRSRSGSGTALLGAVYGDVDLSSGSGQVEIGLPAGHSVRLDVTTGSGRVNSELPIEDAPTEAGPKLSIRARTGSGNIRLFRAA
ncbi:MAG: DUF4097 family beta strand repeat-containing protein [Actinomycetota bacterium]|nr:DUF4097 family beta strand repeat-containing protein [Actinomycetota bacterium]